MYKRRLLILFVVAVAVQVAILVAIPAKKVRARVAGQSIFLKVRPVDPYNIMSGYHAVLNYEISNPASFPSRPSGEVDACYAVVEKAPDGFWNPVALGTALPTGLPAGRAVLAGRMKDERILYGIEEYYIPEEEREQIDEDLRHPRRVRVEVKVDSSGRAALVGLTRTADAGEQERAESKRALDVMQEAEARLKAGKPDEAMDGLLAYLAVNGGLTTAGRWGAELASNLTALHLLLLEAAYRSGHLERLIRRDLVVVRTAAPNQKLSALLGEMKASRDSLARWTAYLCDSTLWSANGTVKKEFFQLIRADASPIVRYKGLSFVFGRLERRPDEEAWLQELGRMAAEDADPLNRTIAQALFKWKKHTPQPNTPNTQMAPIRSDPTWLFMDSPYDLWEMQQFSRR